MKDITRNFLNNNKKDIFIYFKENSSLFPGCCIDVALMLKYFLKEYFAEDFKIVKGNKKLYPNRKKFHIWLENGEDIVDFTLFQFYIGRKEFKLVKADEVYEYCIEDIQRGDIIFRKLYYEKIFINITEPDIKTYMNQYLKSIWDVPVDKNVSAKKAIKMYFKECENIIKLG